MQLFDTTATSPGTADTDTLETKVLATFSMYENSSANLIGRATVRKLGTTQSASFLVHIAAARGTGNAVVNGVDLLSQMAPLGFVAASVSVDTDGSDVQLKCNGALLTDLHWAGCLMAFGEFDE